MHHETTDGAGGGDWSRPEFSAGMRVVDTEQDGDDGLAVVVGVTDQLASEYHIEAINQTVAECNPSYPVDDRVIKIVFEDDVDDHKYGLMEKDAHIKTSRGQDFGETLAKNLRNHDDTRVYSYPASRLRPCNTQPQEGE